MPVNDPIFEPEFKLIEGLLIRYGRFDIPTLVKLLRSKTSTARKLSSAYSKYYESINNSKAYTAVTVGHFALKTGSRHLEASEQFSPTTIANVGQSIVQSLNNHLQAHASVNGLKINEAIDFKGQTHLISVEELPTSRSDKHRFVFGVIDHFLSTVGSIDLFELLDVARLENLKQAKYILNLYATENELEYIKKEGIYVKKEGWKPLICINELSTNSILVESS